VCVDPCEEVKNGLLAHAETEENTFLVGKWQHLALTYKEQSENKKKTSSQIVLWVSGQ
ncbi:hypothetical protein XELAEV_1802688919mg, partial [Xenopus laevis]